ncbi:MAG: hypothetical protein HRU77_01295 [Gammaproteobacteria bacterium]|nr:MAG: hypothetical protein HRU77_01295 [Gammaproteobacteria bacterium]
MAQLDEESWKIVAAAQRYEKSGDPSELNEYDLSALKKADYQLGNRDVNTGWRKAIQDLIHDIESTPEIIEAKPGAFGITLNLNAFIKRLFKYFCK